MKLKTAYCLSALVAAAPQSDERKDDGDDVFRSHCASFCEMNTCTSDRGNTNADLFLSYGSAAGDTEGASRDDTAEGPVRLSEPVSYFGRFYTDAYFSSNGVISFNYRYSGFTSQAFPIYSTNRIMFTPFWADMNPYQGGNWYYRILNAQDKAAVNAVIQYELDISDFEAVDGFVVTWRNVRFYGSQRTTWGRDRKNSVQAILAHDNDRSFIIFNYGDIEWVSTRDKCTGMGGTAAQVGFNDGYGNFYSVPGSQTDDIMDIETRTNVKSTGRFIFQVNDVEIIDPQTFSISSTQTQTGIEQFLEYKGFDTSMISNHGCFCKNLNEAAYGNTVDGLDRICKNWIHARMCSLKIDGQCNEAADSEYEAGTDNCENAGTGACDDAACGIDEYWFNELDSYLASNPDWSSESTTCERGPQSFFRDHCCGNDPATMAMYSPDDETCEAGEVFPIVSEFLDETTISN
jgi:hypothetical protein